MDARELTSAESGFAFARQACGGGPPQYYGIHELSAGPLQAFLSSDDESQVSLDGAAHAWWKRGAPQLEEAAKAKLDALMGRLDEERPIDELEAYGLRLRLRSYFDAAGGDLSPIAGHGFDLRRWILNPPSLALTGRLVVLGASLMGSLDAISMRRHLAMVVQNLPPRVQASVRKSLEATQPLDAALVRRIYEVYSRILQEQRSPQQELALLGLFFLISAAAFRQGRAMRALKEALPKQLALRVDPFYRACVQSGKPDLSLRAAPVVEAVHRALQESEGR